MDWFPWGDAAFERARSEGKPIFLSIGYSTCHWCHVMERESFENPEIASILNDLYVSIKVDREERPDVDRVYMTAVQALTGSGGWPLSAWLTPELEPFYAGTYFPPAARSGLPGFRELLLQLGRAWSERQDEVRRSAASVVDALRRLAVTEQGSDLEAARVLHRAYVQFQRLYDPEHGGFGGPPKFPRPSALGFLLRYGAYAGEPNATEMALATLRHMWRGGINDHLGGGFHRYSVDGYWRVPHFEKMLYDQAQLVWAFLDAYQVAGDRFYADAARRVLDYVLQDLTSEEGAFFSAEDADSAPDPARPEEREEGAYYMWELAEVQQLLEEDEAAAAATYYGVSAAGNTLHDPHGELGDRNVLYAACSMQQAAAQLEIDEEEIAHRLERGRRKLLAARAGRLRPHLDDKILTSWNGLMISAFARAHQVLDDRRYLEAARRAATFVLENNVLPHDEGGGLRRRYREGEARHPAHLDDYAFLALGLLDLYEADFDIDWLRGAETLTAEIVRRFADEENGGFFDGVGDDPSILVRSKEAYDGAEPAGNSIAALVLLRLGHMLDRSDLLQRSRQLLRSFSARLEGEPQALPQMLVALALDERPPRQAVLAGTVGDERSRRLLAVLHRRYLPDLVLLGADGGEGQQHLAAAVPYLGTVAPLDGRPAVYLCEAFTCKAPTSDPEELARLLDGGP